MKEKVCINLGPILVWYNSISHITKIISNKNIVYIFKEGTIQLSLIWKKFVICIK